MNLKTSNKIWVGYTAALILFLVTFFFTFFKANKLSQYGEDVRYNSTLMNQLDMLIYKAKNVETRFREFMFSRKESVIPKFQNAYADVSKQLKNIDSASVKQLQTEIDSLQFLINDFYQTTADGIAYYRKMRYEMDTTMMAFGLEVVIKMERINNKIVDIHGKQSEKLDHDYQQLSKTTSTVAYINIFLFVLSIGLMIYSLFSYLKEHRAKETAFEKNERYAIELEKRVNELAAANQELASLRSLEKFAATGRIARTIAHEVRNPLTNINLAADQMQAQLQEKQVDANMLISMILRNSHRINQLISDLLNSTKFLELSMEKQSVHKVLDESLDMAKDRIGLQSIKVEKSYSDDCEVMMDLEKMKIAFLNIIVNAIEAMEPGKGILRIQDPL
jgi:C4-dicarboxylate-specific signal transduction histidine kinase